MVSYDVTSLQAERGLCCGFAALPSSSYDRRRNQKWLEKSFQDHLPADGTDMWTTPGRNQKGATGVPLLAPINNQITCEDVKASSGLHMVEDGRLTLNHQAGNVPDKDKEKKNWN